MINTSPKLLWRYAVFNLVLLLAFAAWFLHQNTPVALTEAHLPPASKLQCVSYAPYYGKGMTPFIKGTVISPTQIDEDLQLLAQRFDCVRIYSVGQGLDHVPEAAAKAGIKVYLGVWIGWDDAENMLELNSAIALANRYPDVVKAMIVGNEVLLRREQTVQAMQTYLAHAKSQTKVPVTYADVWEFWIKNKQLEQSVDFLTVHVLPYWEDDPQPVERAVQHASGVMEELKANFSKPLLIGETGWPSVGRQRKDSIPSLLNQAEYLRSFLQTAQQKGWNYNLIEAMDQPWKRVLEGTVGGYWGLYDTDLQPKFAFSGPVSERHDGQPVLQYTVAGSLLFLLLSLAVGERRVSGLLATLLLGALAGASAYLQLEYLQEACRNQLEWLALGSVCLIGGALLLSLPALLVNRTGSAMALARSCIWLLAIAMTIASLLSLPTLQIVNGFDLKDPFITGLLFNIDGRYRDFPVALYALPVLQAAIGFSLLQIPGGNFGRYFKPLVVISVLAMVACLAFELNNLRALYWLGLVVVMGYVIWPRRAISVFHG